MTKTMILEVDAKVPYIVTGLHKAGFTGGGLEAHGRMQSGLAFVAALAWRGFVLFGSATPAAVRPRLQVGLAPSP